MHGVIAIHGSVKFGSLFGGDEFLEALIGESPHVRLLRIEDCTVVGLLHSGQEIGLVHLLVQIEKEHLLVLHLI